MRNRSTRVKRRIDRYLAGVGRALDHIEAEERREVLRGLRTHIHEELAQRSGTSPSLDDVRAVLESMDPPEAYRAGTAGGSSSRASRSRTLGRLGFWFFVGACAVFLLGVVLGSCVADAFFRVGAILAIVGSLCALGIGAYGWRDPYGKAAVIGAVVALAVATALLPVRQTASGPSAPEPVVEVHGDSGDP